MNAAPCTVLDLALSGVRRFGNTAATALVASSLMLAVGSANAGVGLAVTPVVPLAVFVGQAGLSASVVIEWRNTPNNETHNNFVTNISFTPSCGISPSPPSDICAAQEGTLPIQPANVGMGSDGCRSSAAPGVSATGRQFQILPLGGQPGTYSISPAVGDLLLLAPPPGQPGGVCIITFPINVVSKPVTDASAARSGLQTAALAGASATDQVNGDNGGGVGAALVSFPDLQTTPSPGGALGGNLALSDTATITGLVPSGVNVPPKGTVTFNLFSPADPGCNLGPPFGTQTVNLSDPARCTITPVSFLTRCTMAAPIVVNQAGTWRWTANYNPNPMDPAQVDPNNVPVGSDCTKEPVQVGKTPTNLNTIPNPSPGKFGTALNDTAQLSSPTNGVPPYTGNITFELYDPTQPNCAVGTQRYMQVVPVNGAGAAATAPGFVADMVGTWNWKASYAGDGNYFPSVSACGAEPVVVPPPVLTIVKTPKGQAYTAGQTISFTITVTNQGPGTAINTRFQPPTDVLPDINKSLNWSISQQPVGLPGACTLAGPIGTQTLSCNFGNMLEGTSLSVTVQTATQANDPGDCGNPLALTNTATVVADNAAAKTDTGSLICQNGGTTIVTTTNPPAGKVGGPALNDSAQLTANPPNAIPWTGTIKFDLYDPMQNCNLVPPPAPRFTQIVNVSMTGAASTTVGFVPDKSGLWQWVATYSGDANHVGAISPCGAEPVNIAFPRLLIEKTPDNGTVVLGSPIKWMIKVTNQGPGTAQGVAFQPADILPDPNKLLNWSVETQPAGGNCTIAGPIGTQALNCRFGDMLEGASATVVVSSPTQANNALICPVGVTLTNSATVAATNAIPVTDTGTQICPATPVLRLQKTPDGGAFTAGDTIRFSLAVTNLGPGVATKVRIEPADLLPDPASSLNWSVDVQPTQGTCTVSGGIGSQVLNCNFGDMQPNQTLTVTVKTDTQASDPGDCSPNGTVLNNTATVIGDNTNPATDSGSQGCKNSRPIPTMSPLGLALLILLLAATAVVVLRKRYR